MEPRHGGYKEEFLPRQIPVLPSILQHMGEASCEVCDRGVVGCIGANLVSGVYDAAPDLPQERFKRWDEIPIGSSGSLVGIEATIIGSVVQVHAEHPVVGVPSCGADVRSDMARQLEREEGRSVPVKQFLGGPQPSLALFRGGLEPLPVQILVQDPTKDLVDPRVLDHVGVDQVIKNHSVTTIPISVGHGDAQEIQYSLQERVLRPYRPLPPRHLRYGTPTGLCLEPLSPGSF